MTIAHEQLKDPERCHELWREHGSINGVARVVGCSYHTAKRLMGKAGIKPGMRPEGGAKEKPPVELEPEMPRITVTKDGDTEVFLIDGVAYRIPLDMKREIYALYSRDGGNAQIATIELEFAIPRSAFEAIKNYWGLTHSSPMWPDEDIAKHDPDDLIEEGLANRKRLLHRRFKAREIAWYKEQYERLAHRASVEDRLIEHAVEHLGAWKPPNIIVPYRKPLTGRRLVIGLGDRHTGKRTLPLVASPGFDKDILRERMERLKEGVVQTIRDASHSIEEIIVIDHGDGLDNPLGTTYPRQDRGQDLHGWEQVLEGATLFGDFVYFVSSIAKLVHVVVIPGNHDEDFGIVAAHMAMQRLEKCDHVTHDISDTRYGVVERGNNRFISLHGQTLRRGVAARENSIMKTIMMLGKPGMRHYVTSGHLHHLDSAHSATKEGTGYEWFQVPSMVGGDEYSEGNFQATSRPAQLALMVDDDEGVLYPRRIYVD